MSELAPAAPAQSVADSTPATPTAPPPLTATRAAAIANDFSAFDKAHVAAREGKPLPDVPATSAPSSSPEAAAADPLAPTPTLSKRQQEINERAQRASERAVETATAQLREEIAQLRAHLAREAPKTTPTDPPATPEWQRYLAMPDAPKLEQFASVEAHSAAMALFVHRQLGEEQAARGREESALKDFGAKRDSYHARMSEAAKADPELRTKIAPELHTAVPISGFPTVPDGRGGMVRIDPRTGQPAQIEFKNLIAEVAFHSERPAALYAYLSQHQDEAQRIVALPAPQVMQELTRLDGWLVRSASTTASAPATPVAPAPSTITAAPPPPPSVTGAGTTADPKSSALARGDFAAFDKLEMAALRAKLAHA